MAQVAVILPQLMKPKAASLLERAIEIAVQAHKGQRDRNGDPYVLHPLRLMLRGRTAEEKIVAVLHDVVEDSEWTLEQLRAEGFPAKIVAAVDNLTKRPRENYTKFVRRSASHPLSRQIKIFDLEDNMNPLRLKTVDAKALKRLKKYVRAWRFLHEQDNR